MPNPNETVIIIPAFNEEKWIGNTIDLIRKTKVSARIIVVNDGSTDKTAEIAASKGSDVVTISHRGKANAFFAGLSAALKLNPKAIVTIDADAYFIPKKVLKKMISEASEATSRNKAKMIFAPTSEGIRRIVYPASASGIRSFSLPAAWRIHTTKMKKFVKGFGLEEFQNAFLRNKAKQIKEGYFHHREAFKGSSATSVSQAAEIHLMRGKMEKNLKRILR
ncbi:MAG: glycosyltransferase [archaeon]